MDEFVDEFSGLPAYRAFGADVNIGGLGEMGYPARA